MTRKRKDFLWGNELPGSSSVLNSPQQDVKETYQFYCYKYRLDPKYNDFADLEIKDGAWRRACTFVKCREWSSKVSSLLYGVPHDLIHSDYLMRAKSVDSDQASQLILGGFWHHHGHRSESTHVHHTYFHYKIDEPPIAIALTPFVPSQIPAFAEIPELGRGATDTEGGSIRHKLRNTDACTPEREELDIIVPEDAPSDVSFTHEVDSITSSFVTRISIDNLVPCTHPVAPIRVRTTMSNLSEGTDISEMSIDHLEEELTARNKLVDYLEDGLDVNQKQMNHLMMERKRLLADPNLFGLWGEYHDVEAPAGDGSLI